MSHSAEQSDIVPITLVAILLRRLHDSERIAFVLRSATDGIRRWFSLILPRTDSFEFIHGRVVSLLNGLGNADNDSAVQTKCVFECLTNIGLYHIPECTVTTELKISWKFIDGRPVFSVEGADARRHEVAGQLQLIANSAFSRPDKPINEYSLVTSAAVKVLPDPGKPLETPHFRPIVEDVDTIAAASPHTPAIEYSGRVHSYQDLACLAKSVAATVASRGIAKGEIVAVTGSRSFQLIAGMLGVLRTRAVLVTLDPNLPLARRRIMLQSTGAKLLLTAGNSSYAEGLEDLCPIEQIKLLDKVDVAVESPCDQDAAYIFFTSGSTGVPKAVVGRHAGLSHFLDWQRSVSAIGPGDRASQLTAISFDVVLRDVFLALTSGATLVIPGETTALDPRHIVRWLAHENITTIHVVPSLARLWLEASPVAIKLPSLRRVFFAGEPLQDALITHWRSDISATADIFNLYGPTETTLAKCCHRVSSSPEPGIQPVGTPLPQTQALVLTKERRLCGIGEIGEIVIRTPFRTLGYLNNPEANANAFIHNPFRDDPEDLLYLTGDAGYYRSDGTVQILGRIDNQVKIRGVRIEPGEIESYLSKHPSVRENAVIALTNARGDKELVAYYSIRENTEKVTTETLREYLRRGLAEVMVPTRFVPLDRLPLNSNGKIDRRSLPAPDANECVVAVDVAPRDDLERILCGCWQFVLDRTDIHGETDFFDAGGHSLLAARLAMQIETETKRKCTLTMLFRNRTPRRLAAELRAGGADNTEAAIITLQSQGAGSPYFCICGIHLYQNLADALGTAHPVYAIFLPFEQEILRGDKSKTAFPSVETMAAEYIQEIRKINPDGPYRLIGSSFGGIIAYEIAQQLRRDQCTVSVVVLLDTMLPWSRRISRTRAARKFISSRLRSLKRRLGLGLASASDSDNQLVRMSDMRETIYTTATDRYAPKPYEGSVLLIRATDKMFSDWAILDHTYGWASLAKRLSIVDVEGNHLGILEGTSVASTAAAISAAVS